MTLFLITFRSAVSFYTLFFQEEPSARTECTGEEEGGGVARGSEGRGKGKGRGRGRGKGKEWRVRGVESRMGVGIYDVPVHESERRSEKERENKGWVVGEKVEK